MNYTKVIFFFLWTFAHFASGSWSAQAPVVSSTNPDSTYISTTSHTSYIRDSTGDSVITYSRFASSTPLTMAFGVTCQDTNTYELIVKQNNVPIATYFNPVKGINSYSLSWIPFNTLASGDKFSFSSIMKTTATKKTSIQRWYFNFILQ